MECRAVRGATTVANNTAREIEEATTEVLQKIIRENKIRIKDIVSAYFSVTVDLNAQFPAAAARKMGWTYVPMLCTYELDVPSSLRQCIRVLLTYNTRKAQHKIKHQYLRGATLLRPDLVEQ
ncbi:MAG: chorismate mutase [Candidatus Margulisbacteria bacterium]|jgi:chorismate mutase|nr:chorismate mutase [Candidatus Margulisiibacteriota bacterium]